MPVLENTMLELEGSTLSLTATDMEMKKVNWSSKREIIGSTWVVVIVAVSIAAILFVVDIFFKELFSAIGILTGGSYFVDLFKSLFG